AHTVPLTDFDELEGGGACPRVFTGRPFAGPAQQQPGPLELVPWLDDASLDARRGIPVAVEEFAQRAAARVDELRQRELDDFIGDRFPQRALGTHLAAGERRFDK